MPIAVFNTMTRHKELLTTIEDGVVKMFVCGPTVYDLSHVGHAKTYTQFDLVARYLRYRGYRVHYLQNLTDIDDKIIRRANELAVEPRELTSKFEALYLEDMEALGNTSVDTYARAHDYIDQICEQVTVLIDRGHAYRIDDGWYFDLSSSPDYGKLSGRTHVREEDSVSRIDENPKKRNAGDFVLWKTSKPNEPSWDTDLGRGRPGWHIEDTAITEAVFGPQYDLHGGAVDLIFPHHEAEIAQMECASGLTPMVRHWIHAGLLRIGDAKMAKSAGNFVTIREALEKTSARILRFAFLSQHYRSPMELSYATVENASGALGRIDNFRRSIDAAREFEFDGGELLGRTKESFFFHMDDDFDTPAALASLFDLIREYNRRGETPGTAVNDFLSELDGVFLVFNHDGGGGADDPVIEEKVRLRDELRRKRSFAEADVVREELTAMGVVIEDFPSGARWYRVS